MYQTSLETQQIWNGYRRLHGSVWEDISTGETFDAETNWYSSHAATGDPCVKMSLLGVSHSMGIEAPGFNSNSIYFITKPERFINGNIHDSHFVHKYCAPFYGDNIKCTPEAMFGSANLNALEKFKDSKILIVAGGPSAAERQWDPSDYDYVFSCNHFYLNEKLSKHDVAYAIFADEVALSLKNERLINYLNANSTIVCLDDRIAHLAHARPSKRQEAEDTVSFLNKEYPDQHMFVHFRYRSRVGTGTRLILSAIFFGAKQIHFVGVDGMAPDTKIGDLHNHAFQEGKRYNSENLQYDRYRRHYTAFWHYVINGLKAHERIEFQNLGEGHRCNQSTDISRQLFPLIGATT